MRTLQETSFGRFGSNRALTALCAILSLGLGLAGISLAAVPISLIWLINGLWLGRRNEALAREATHRPRVETGRQAHLTTP